MNAVKFVFFKIAGCIERIGINERRDRFALRNIFTWFQRKIGKFAINSSTNCRTFKIKFCGIKLNDRFAQCSCGLQFLHSGRFQLLACDGFVIQFLVTLEIALRLIVSSFCIVNHGLSIFQSQRKTRLINLEKNIALFDMLVIDNIDLGYKTGNIRGDTDNIGAYFTVSRPWVIHVIIP